MRGRKALNRRFKGMETKEKEGERERRRARRACKAKVYLIRLSNDTGCSGINNEARKVSHVD